MKFVRAYHTVRTLRKITAGIVGCRREPLPMAIPLLRYALHAMTYPHLSALNRQWALGTPHNTHAPRTQSLIVSRVVSCDSGGVRVCGGDC
jgi:hypothetical protein